MRKAIILTATAMMVLVGCKANNHEVETENSDSITFLVEQPELNNYIEESYNSDFTPDIQWNDSPSVNDWTEEEQNKAIQLSKEVLVSLEVVEEIDDYTSHLNGEFISAKYRAGFNYLVLPDTKEPHNNIYIETKDSKAYKLNADKEAVQKLIQWMNEMKNN
jgi:hypothetical protein